MYNLQDQIELIKTNQRINSLKSDDIYGIALLQTLISGYPFLPFTGASLRPYCIAQIINDITINNRSQIIEFGSGLSTILIARLIKKNNLKAEFLSVDHNKDWVSTLSKILEREGLADIVNLCYAPLKECELAIENASWYDLQVLKKEIDGKTFDLMIIDGPPAWETNKNKARYPAVPCIADNLEDSFSIYLDDADRDGEKAIIALWEKEYGIKFGVSTASLAYYSRGNGLFTHPLAYNQFTINSDKI